MVKLQLSLPVVKMVTSWFIGENSKKRTIGFAYLLAVSAVYLFTGYIDGELYSTLMTFGVLWTGSAFSAKISKLAKAVENMKENK